MLYRVNYFNKKSFTLLYTQCRYGKLLPVKKSHYTFYCKQIIYDVINIIDVFDKYLSDL